MSPLALIVASYRGQKAVSGSAAKQPLAARVVFEYGFHGSPPSFLGPDIGVPGAGLLMQPLHLLEGDELVDAGINRLVGGGQVVEELGLFIVVQVVLTNVLI